MLPESAAGVNNAVRYARKADIWATRALRDARQLPAGHQAHELAEGSRIAAEAARLAMMAAGTAHRAGVMLCIGDGYNDAARAFRAREFSTLAALKACNAAGRATYRIELLAEGKIEGRPAGLSPRARGNPRQ